MMESVTIIGLGYVGLPLFCLVAEKGYQVSGVDIIEAKLRQIKQHQLTYEDEIVKRFYQNDPGHLRLTSNASETVPDSDIIVICVPTPVDSNRMPDFSPLMSAIQSIVSEIRPEQLVIVESTIYPGTIEEIVLPILVKSGLKPGKDFYIAHCPERIDPGNKKWTLKNIPRVCGALSQKGLQHAVKFYESIIDAPIYPLSSLKAAEACKVVENSFRDINIAFVNELAMSFDKMGIDTMEVIQGAATKPFAFLPHYPGSGVGGHCIPVDPYYLIKKAADIGFDHEFLRMARKINDGMPNYTVILLRELISQAGRSLKDSTIGLLGIAFKRGIGDFRNSPYFQIKEILEVQGGTVLAFDPNVRSLSSVSTIDELLEESDFLILITDHPEFLNLPPSKLAESGIIGIIDGRNALSKEGIKDLGILYKGIGQT
ncbi:MAG: nucleotide sugar dehydrogenase [Candidatus Heimdallarchaeota archaeon]